MNFQKEYDILCSINSDEILEISYNFKNHRIKIYFNQNDDSEFLTLICESNEFTFVKNYGIYFSNGVANINGYWGKYYDYAGGLSNNNGYGFSDFYSKLKEAIQNVNNPNEEFQITFLNNNEGIRRIRNYTAESVHPNDPIYFHYVKRVPISPKQFDKVVEQLGSEVAKYLKSSNLTAVFTSDITKQKSFILISNGNNGN